MAGRKMVMQVDFGSLLMGWASSRRTSHCSGI